MKKLTIVFLCILCFAGCADKASVVTRDTTEALSVLKSGDARTFIQDAVVEYENTELFNFTNPGSYNKIFYSLDYNILGTEKVDKNTFTINMDITMLDFTALKQNTYINLHNSAALEYLTIEFNKVQAELPPQLDDITNSLIDFAQKWTEDDIRTVIDNEVMPSLDVNAKNAFIDAAVVKQPSKIVEILESGEQAPFRTTNITMKVTKVAGNWKICVDEQLFKALIGYSDSEDYETVKNGDFLSYRTLNHSWFKKAISTKPGVILTHWVPDSSFYMNIILIIAIIVTFTYFGIFKRRGIKQ